MSTQSPSSADGNIKCQSCGHENDPTRVFCHNCGIRLERPDGTVAEIERAEREGDRKAAEARRRLAAPKKKPGPPIHVVLLRGLFSFVRISILAALLAVLILIFRAPDGVPPEATGAPEEAEALHADVFAAANARFRTHVVITEDQANNFLLEKVDITGGKIPGLGAVEGRRTYVVLRDGGLQLGAEYGLFGLRCFLTADYSVGAAGGGLTAEPQSFAIGRLPLPKALARGPLRWDKTLANALETEMQALAAADRIELSEGKAALSWQGAQ